MAKERPSDILAVYYICTVIISIGILEITDQLLHTEKKQIAINYNVKSVQQKTANTEKILPKVIVDTSSFKIDTLTEINNTIPKNSVELSNNSIYFANLMQNYQNNMGAMKNPKSRTDIVIRYYTKTSDEDKIYSLRDLGYYIHERPSQSSFQDFASNTICFGDSVNKEDIILIAYQLISKGVVLQDISLSKYHDDWKAFAVEIGTDTAVFEQPPITLTDLRTDYTDF